MMKRWLEMAKRLPAPGLIVATVLCLLLQENYPFSDFPMYSSFASNSSYVFVSDREGEPLPVESLAGVRTSKLKKIFMSHLRDHREALEASGVEIHGFQFMTLEQRTPSGRYALEWLVENSRDREALAPHRPLQFTQVVLKVLDDRTIERRPYTISEEVTP